MSLVFRTRDDSFICLQTLRGVRGVLVFSFAPFFMNVEVTCTIV